MQRRSDQDSDGTTWAPVSLRVGLSGLDLRRPGDPQALTECLNARFLDEKTLRRRDGHTGYAIRDGSNFTTGTHGDWVYGHGTRTTPADAGANERTHVPRHRRGGLTFNYLGANVVWTGDRLLTIREDGFPAVGASANWWKDANISTPLEYGIPAYLPSAVDSPVPFGVYGTPIDGETSACVETCLTRTTRVIGQIVAGSPLLYVFDRETKAELDRTDLGLTACTELRVINSGEVPVALWKDGIELYESHYTGAAWTTPSLVDASVIRYEVAPFEGGFHVILVGYDDPDYLVYAGRFLAGEAVNTPYAFKTEITGYTGVPTHAAIGVARTGEIGVAVATDTNVCVVALSESLVTLTGADWELHNVDDAVAVCIQPRALARADGRYPWVVHVGREFRDDGVDILSYFHSASSSSILGFTTRHNCALASRSFQVGDEVFAWLNSSYTRTLFLLAGRYAPVVAGYADRETALLREHHVSGSEGAPGVGAFVHLPMVTVDPLDAHTFTWVRPYDTGVDHAHPGNARVGDLNFLPHPTYANFGRSVYISGSAVKNWDGRNLADAGFQEYPIVSSAVPAGVGLCTAGVHQIFARAVRYNARGERFSSAALTTSATSAGSDTIPVIINTLPGVSTDDVVLEVYMTEAGGTTFYYAGAVANDFDNPTVTYTISVSDAVLITRRPDPHETGVAGLEEIENFGPLGCEILVAHGDRLWGAGGQVPAGQVQFSKLWAANTGAGFDALDGTQVVDAEGATITSLSAYFDALAVFQRNRVFALDGLGPNNYGSGSFGPAQVAVTDGAVTHWGTLMTQAGVVFWGDGGPRLLTPGVRVVSLCEPVYPLSSTLTPTGVRVDLSRREVVWYTFEGDALLVNLAGAQPRWARWTGVPAAAVSPEAVITPLGTLLVEDPEAAGDAGTEYTFAFATGNLSLSDLLQGGIKARRVGISGDYHGPHTLRMRVFYDGSPLWHEESNWEPDDTTWLTLADDLSALTPAQIDALTTTDRSGRYAFHKRLDRQTCSHFRVFVSDRGSSHPTFTPHALALEIGAKAGLGRTNIATIGD
jgi:hypothetical protein